MNDGALSPYNPATAFRPTETSALHHHDLSLRVWPLPLLWTGDVKWGWSDVGRERTYYVHAVCDDGDDVQVFECKRRLDLEAALGIFNLTGALVRAQRMARRV